MAFYSDHRTNKHISAGSGTSLGAQLTAEGVNFAVFSQYAKSVYLLLFDSPEENPSDVIKIEDKTPDHVWHVFVHGIKEGQLYGYKIDGDYSPPAGLRFNPQKLLIDPYAKSLALTRNENKEGFYAYDLHAADRDLVKDQRDNAVSAPKSMVVDDAFDWQDDRPPGLSVKDLIIYETHIKGFTAHPSSGVQCPGTYLGFIEKIPYLKKLGITAVEFLPVHECYVQDHLLKKGLSNYWGYDPIGFFAPNAHYGTGRYPGCQVHEFKALVREMHKAGLEVILDMVFNHTAEGNHLGPTLCFKGLDNPTYYCLMQNSPQEPYRFYRNDTGCGNTLNIEHPVVLRLVMDCLRYWVEVMHVDGFRFDLATVLGRKEGQFSQDSAFFNAIGRDPALKYVKKIAEPWDLTTYQVGSFPKGWLEWNGKFRDTVRKFITGHEGQAADLGRRLTGSIDLYVNRGRKIYESINFVTCHDGFTMNDLFSYNYKHNEANQEENRDGSNDNNSWNCGVEGPSQDEEVVHLRKQMVKNALCYLFFAFGTPMVLYGDEVMRTQNGNNNAWCQNNPISWMDWELLGKNAEIFMFFRRAVEFRKKYPFWGRAAQIPEIIWFDNKLCVPRWNHPKLKTVCCQIKIPAEFVSDEHVGHLFFIWNADRRGGKINLPRHEGFEWVRLVDTARKAGDDFCLLEHPQVLNRQDQTRSAARSVILLVSKNA